MSEKLKQNKKMKKFKELSIEEMKEVEGGGWIADAVEWFISIGKCGCEVKGRTGPVYGYGGVLGYQMH
jgi:bacteriocin-like protein